MKTEQKIEKYLMNEGGANYVSDEIAEKSFSKDLKNFMSVFKNMERSAKKKDWDTAGDQVELLTDRFKTIIGTLNRLAPDDSNSYRRGKTKKHQGEQADQWDWDKE